MSRSGQFSGPSEEYGVPLSVVLTPDNNLGDSLFHQSLNDPKLKLDQAEKDRLQQEIDDLLRTLQLSGEVP